MLYTLLGIILWTSVRGQALPLRCPQSFCPPLSPSPLFRTPYPPPTPYPRAPRSVFVKTGNRLYMADTCSGRQRSQTSVCLADLLSKFVPLSRMPYLPLPFLAVPSGSGSNPPRKRRERGHSEVLGWGGKGVGDAVAYSGFVRCLYTFR